jgi:hypothetical protein
VNRERRYLGLALVLALPMSQLGHALAYVLQRLPSDHGVHAYFPNLLASAEWTLAGSVLGVLVVVGLARMLNPGYRAGGRAVAFLPVLTALLAAQLLVFVFQETIELASVGQAPGAALLGFGAAGQAPVALSAAVAIRWLSQRLEPALRALALTLADAACAAPSPATEVRPATVAQALSSSFGAEPAPRSPPPQLGR